MSWSVNVEVECIEMPRPETIKEVGTPLVSRDRGMASQMPITPAPRRVQRFYPSPSPKTPSIRFRTTLGNSRVLREATPSSLNRQPDMTNTLATPEPSSKRPKFKQFGASPTKSNLTPLSSRSRRPKLEEQNVEFVTMSQTQATGPLSAEMKNRMQEIEWKTILDQFEVSEEEHLVLNATRLSDYAWKVNPKTIDGDIVLLDPFARYTRERLMYNYIRLGKPLHEGEEKVYADWHLVDSLND